jgi:putative transcriptional regulator
MKKKRASRRPTFGEELLESVRQAIAIQRGELEPARVTRRLLTAKDLRPAPAPRYSERAIRSLRERMQLSQPVFAHLLNVSPETVKSWEQGKNYPAGAAARLIQIAEKHPDLIAQAAGGKTRKVG